MHQVMEECCRWTKCNGKTLFEWVNELMGKLASSSTTNIGMLPSINFANQCIHILNNKERLNGLKGRTKMQKRQSQFKYLSRINNVQRNSYVDHRSMKI